MKKLTKNSIIGVLAIGLTIMGVSLILNWRDVTFIQWGQFGCSAILVWSVFVRINTAQGGLKLSDFEYEYKDILGDAFIEQPKKRRQLILTTALINKERMEHARMSLSSLYKEATTIDEKAAINFFIGFAYDEEYLFEEAVTYYKKVIALRPRMVEPLGNIARIYHEFGEYDKALDCYDKAIEIQPTNGVLLSAIAHVYMEKLEVDKAKYYAERALEYDQSSLAAMEIMAMIYAVKGQAEEARRWKKQYMINGGDDIERLEETIENMLRV